VREPRFTPPNTALDVSVLAAVCTCCNRLLGAVCRFCHLVARLRHARSSSLCYRVCALLLLLWGGGAKPGLHLMYMAPT